MLTFFYIIGAFIFGAGAALVGAVIWAKHNRKKIDRVLNFFDVQARIDELLDSTTVDEKIKETLKGVREKIDKIMK